MGPVDFQKCLRIFSRFIECSPVGKRHHLILSAVNDQKWTADIPDVMQSVVSVPQNQAEGDKGKVFSCQGRGGFEGGLEDELSRSVGSGQPCRDGSADRPSKEDYFLCWIARFTLSQETPGSFNVEIQAFFRRMSSALTVAPIVEEQDTQAQAVEDKNRIQPVRHITGVSMAEQNDSLRIGGGRSGDKPCRQLHAVCRSKTDVGIVEPHRSGGLEDAFLGHVDQMVLEHHYQDQGKNVERGGAERECTDKCSCSDRRLRTQGYS